MSTYQVSQPRQDKYKGARMYVAAPSGWARKSDGTIYRDGTCPRSSGPEMTWKLDEAYAFTSLKAAQMQAAKLSNGIVARHWSAPMNGGERYCGFCGYGACQKPQNVDCARKPTGSYV